MLRCLEAKSRTPALYIIRVYFFREIFVVGVWELSWARYTVVCRVRERLHDICRVVSVAACVRSGCMGNISVVPLCKALTK